MLKNLHFISFFFMFLAINSAKAHTNSCQQDNEIVFIFKKNDHVPTTKYRTISGTINPIYISEQGDFKRSELIINNKSKTDTISRSVKGDLICMTYIYDSPKTYYYLFQKGDTIIFDYENGVPKATIFGRKTKEFDCNFEVSFKIQKPLDDFEFFDQNKRMRNELESKKHKTEIHDYTVKIHATLDSLFAKDLISKNVMKLYKEHTKYYEINVNKELLSKISADDLKQDDLLYMRGYQFFLDNYITKKIKETNTKSQPDNPKIAFDYVLKSKVFSVIVKDYLLYTTLCRIIESSSNVDSEMYFEKFKQEVHNKEMCNEIFEKYAFDLSKMKEEKKITYFLNSAKQKFTLDEILSKNKNKVIYVDFWASWCGPCRVSIPAFNNLKKMYKDKEVVFVNISIDKDLSAWKMASDKEKLFSSSSNLFAVNYPNAEFYQDLQLKTIPRYLLYNKKGELINNTAPHPESKEIEIELDKLLQE
ncbi:TlpA disulfide reductase family protein [Flavobacterium sp. ASV13]|uniref:TlpA family protein disulfide reductase n=1 Tax=Flavobacterium sp. ASV13 TaxID=1506583 RepID=UPI0009DCDEAA|nr:TlpA disulfide reductase family protein [Flavobacterium sp. ASV13]